MCNVLSVPNKTTESATMQGSTPSLDTPSSRMDQVANPSIDGPDQEPTLLTDLNRAQNLVQQGQASTKVFDGSTMIETFNKALNTNESSDSQKIQSLHIGDEQHNQNLEKALKPTSNQPAENKSQISSESTKTEGTTITKEISSGQHPHLDEEINDAVQAYFNPEQKEVKTADANILISKLIESKITDQDGNIDFEAVIEKYNQNPETNPKLNPKAFKKASIEGKVLIKDGKFDFEISGKCSNEAVDCMTALKKVLEDIKTNQTPPLDVPININPASVGPLSAEDQAALANGGQIQYRSLPNGQVMKLTLDPGSNGEGDGLTIGVYNPKKDHSLEQLSSSPKIPLKVVFEGGELNGQKVGPFLPNWRAEKLFENSIIHSEMNLIGTKTRSTNEDDVGRIQSQNMLWNAVNEYLKASAERTDGHFDISNKPPEDKTKNTHNTNETENAVNNDGNLSGDFGEVHDLSSSESANFNSTSTSADLENATTINENQQGESSIEVIPQEQAQNINSLGLNFAVDIKGKASSTQSNSINSQIENVEDPNVVGINANHSVEIENATITSENSQGVIKKEETPQEQARLTDIHASDGDLGSKDDPHAQINTLDADLDELSKVINSPELNLEDFQKIANKIIAKAKQPKSNTNSIQFPTKFQKDINRLNELINSLEDDGNTLQEKLVENPADTNNTAKKKIALPAKVTQGQKKDSADFRKTLLDAAEKLADVMKNIINNTVDTQEQGQAINSGNNKEELKLKENWKKVMNELLQKMQNKT